MKEKSSSYLCSFGPGIIIKLLTTVFYKWKCPSVFCFTTHVVWIINKFQKTLHSRALKIDYNEKFSSEQCGPWAPYSYVGFPCLASKLTCDRMRGGRLKIHTGISKIFCSLFSYMFLTIAGDWWYQNWIPKYAYWLYLNQVNTVSMCVYNFLRQPQDRDIYGNVSFGFETNHHDHYGGHRIGCCTCR